MANGDSQPADLAAMIQAAIAGRQSPVQQPPFSMVSGLPAGPVAPATPQTGSPMGPTSPVDTSDEAMKQMLLKTSQFGQQAATEDIAKRRAYEEARTAALGEQTKLMQTPPQTAPKNALMRILLGLTGPGRMAEAAYYSPSVQQWESRRKELADRIAALGGQATEAGKAVTPELGAVWHPLTAAGGLSRAEALKMRAEAYSQDVKNRFQVGMTNIGIKQQLLPSEVERNLAQGVLDRALAKVAPERIDLGYAEQDLKANIASEVAQTQADKQGILHRFFNSIFEPSLQAAPVVPGTQPQRGAQPTPPATPSNRRRRSAAPLGSKDNPIVVK